MAAVETGSILEGKVTGITRFGAFVSLPEGKSGLVHISEVANSYVTDVHDFLQVGQSVKVRVMNVSPDGKINLSVKRAEEAAGRAPAAPAKPRSDSGRTQTPPPQDAVAPPSENADFEDRLRRFMKESDSRIADNRMYAEKPRRNNRRSR